MFQLKNFNSNDWSFEPSDNLRKYDINDIRNWFILLAFSAIGLNAEGGYWASILHRSCTIISFPGLGRLVLELFSVSLDYGYIYFISSFLDSTCSFLSPEMELFMAMVSDVKSVTIAMDSSLLRVRNFLLIVWLLLLLLITVSVTSYITYRG